MDMNIDKIRSSGRFMRTVAAIVLVTFTTVTVSPSLQAMQQFATQREAQEQLAAREQQNFDRNLLQAKERLRLMANQAATETGAKPTAEERRKAREELRAWRTEYREMKSRVRAELEATGALLRSKQLPKVILDRQAEALAKLDAESAALERDIDTAVEAADDARAIAKARAAFERLDKAPLQRSQQKFDPAHLPNSALKPNAQRKPKLTAEEFQAALLLSDPAARFAQAGGFNLSQLPGASNPNYLAATVEAVLGADIQAKAAELNRDPIAIYNWVRNNVHWQPTWGAIQDASHTLSARRGNAFDIASLTIALLRASGIPARYVHGTIDVPEDKFRNWAGGFEHIEAAMDFASAGGIPLAAMTSGGRITKVRLEHIWVEAAIDFNPSRGARNRSADSWIALDASFKQIEVLPTLDTVPISGVDLDQLAQTYLASGTTNATEGWVTGFDAAILQNAQNQARDALQNYVEENLPAPTAADVLGGRKIIAQAVPVLAASLPNRVVAMGVRFDSVPSALRQHITFAFGKDIEGEPIDPITLPWAQLNNEQITLSFRPATAADEDALRALLPDGDITDVSQLPSQIPAYLIRVIPELRVEGNVVMSGSALTLGTEVDFVFNPKFVSSGVKPFSYRVPAGSYLAVAAIAGSVDPAQMEKRVAQLQAVQAVANSNDPAQREAVTREQLLGSFFSAGLLSYYAQYDSVARIARAQHNGQFALAGGLGSFGYEVAVDTFFGVPRTIHAGGYAMNIPIVNIVGSDSVDSNGTRDYTIRLGALSSALEHRVPEQFFSTAAAPRQAVSAVKAIQMAIASGQRIYQIDAANAATGLAALGHDAATMAEIQQAVYAGKRVITHTTPITLDSWRGAGYVIMDIETGAAAWKIGGGSNGSWMDEHQTGLIIGSLVAGAILLLASGGLLAILALVYTLVLATASLIKFMDSLDGGTCDHFFLAIYSALTVAFTAFGLRVKGDNAAAIALLIWGNLADPALSAANAGCPSP